MGHQFLKNSVFRNKDELLLEILYIVFVFFNKSSCYLNTRRHLFSDTPWDLSFQCFLCKKHIWPLVLHFHSNSVYALPFFHKRFEPLPVYIQQLQRCRTGCDRIRVTLGHLVDFKLFQTNKTFCKSVQAPVGLYRDANVGRGKGWLVLIRNFWTSFLPQSCN